MGRKGTGVNPLRGHNNVQGACDVGALPDVFPGYQRVTDRQAREKMQKAWKVAELDDKPGLTQPEMLNSAYNGDLKALYIVGENPMLSHPDINHVRESLRNLEFLVVQDVFLSETAKLADVILPAASFAEKDGTFTSTERRVQRVIRRWGLHTICQSGSCPNRQRCFSQGRVTFMILGDICTRSCAFCGVRTGKPLPPDGDEPNRLCAAAKELGLKYVVITSVCRDDLPDGGAAQFVQAIEALHRDKLSAEIEVLIPDFWGSQSALEGVVAAQPTVLNHNVETVPRLYREVRP